MIKRLFLACMLLGMLNACETTTKKEAGGAAVEDRSGPVETDTSGATSYATGEAALGDLSQLDDPQNPLSARIIYFEYDSSQILPQFRNIVEAHSKFLTGHPNVTLILEGHADERGSREYNLALGERRSQAVKRQMVLLGVSGSQIRTTSYGEERPVAYGHDETSWSQNRRVEIIY